MKCREDYLKTNNNKPGFTDKISTMKLIHRFNCLSIGILTIGYVFKFSNLRGGDEMFRFSTLLLALGLILQAINSLQNENVKTEKLRPFFIINSLFLSFAFLSIMIKIGHVGLPFN